MQDHLKNKTMMQDKAQKHHEIYRKHQETDGAISLFSGIILNTNRLISLLKSKLL